MSLPLPGPDPRDERERAATPPAGDPPFARPDRARVGEPATVCVVVGTRPEAIKMAPVVAALREHPALFRPLLLATSQHREMLTQALDVFGLTPDVDLGLMTTGQPLSVFTARAMTALTETFLEHRPDWLLVQGDTSTVTAAALSAFYQGIPVGHVEAGLRSFDLSSPFPEEVNRRVATAVSSLHFAPTEGAREHLVAEGVPPEDVVVTGNTVVDALQTAPRVAHFSTPVLERVLWNDRKVVLVTTHRRENLGAPLRGLCQALRTLVTRDPSVHLVFPVHLNPRVREVVYETLDGHPSITLCDPLPYADLLEVMRRSVLILSDSGGIQEEAPALRTPILVLRDTTERPEVVTAGFGELVGTDPQHVLARADRLLRDANARSEMTAGVNPFGDGHAADRIVEALAARTVPAGERRPPRRLDRAAVTATLGRLALAS